jgi:Bacterial regulatory proteins, luxR family
LTPGGRAADTELSLSRSTVQTHVSHILAKLGARSRPDIAAEAPRHQPPFMSGSQDKQPDGHARVSLPQRTAGATGREPERLCRRGDISLWPPRVSTRGHNPDHATLVVESTVRRVMTTGSGAVLVSALSVLIAGCGGSPEAHAADSMTMTTPAGPVTAAPAVTAVRSHSVPVSVQSDAAMRAAGNQGPSSSILVPSSCKVTAASVTATGTYRDGFAAEIYARYGDVIDLYVFSRPTADYPEGIQLAIEPLTRHSPFIGGNGPWTVTVPLDSTLGQPARCMVAAQPTMDFQGAP